MFISTCSARARAYQRACVSLVCVVCVAGDLLENRQVAHAVDIGGLNGNHVFVQLDRLWNAIPLSHQIRQVEE